MLAPNSKVRPISRMTIKTLLIVLIFSRIRSKATSPERSFWSWVITDSPCRAPIYYDYNRTRCRPYARLRADPKPAGTLARPTSVASPSVDQFSRVEFRRIESLAQRRCLRRAGICLSYTIKSIEFLHSSFVIRHSSFFFFFISPFSLHMLPAGPHRDPATGFHRTRLSSGGFLQTTWHILSRMLF